MTLFTKLKLFSRVKEHSQSSWVRPQTGGLVSEGSPYWKGHLARFIPAPRDHRQSVLQQV
jgi:hypothetical protein